MKRAFLCGDCLRVFDHPTIVTEVERYEFWGTPGFLAGETEVCPDCDSADISDVVLCEKCGFDPTEDGYDLCASCRVKADEAERLDDALMDIARTPLDFRDAAPSDIR